MRVDFLFIVFLCLFSACKSTTDSDGIVAEFNDQKLTTYDIQSIVPKGAGEEDSLKISKSFIKKWSSDKILQSEAENILSDETLNTIKVQVLDYREKLIASYLEDFWLNDSLNIIDSSQVLAYYNANKEGFTTNQDLVQFKFIRVPNDSTRKYSRLFYSKLDKDQNTLNKKLSSYNYINQNKDNQWIAFDELKKMLPLPRITNNRRFLKTSKRLSFTEENHTYFIKFTDYALAGDVAPLVYVEPSVRKIVSNRIKIEKLAKKKKELYEKALRDKSLKIY